MILTFPSAKIGVVKQYIIIMQFQVKFIAIMEKIPLLK